MYLNTKVKGSRAELEVACFLTRNGFVVSFPFGDNAPYDMLAENSLGKLWRIQVRWCTWRKEILRVSLRTSSNGVSKTLNLSRIDAFVIFDGADFFIIPVSKIGERTGAIHLRRSSARNNQLRGIWKSSEYMNAHHLLGS